ncbi:PspC domain-containing protein [Cutibacterium equinum]|uniref:PspC domain-containing protein n=1 Tax=Cutibacterium equinum TaxID=3016342 RepID=A0ABY7QYW9_9ACTN|nr:PspC domain-containing protein [Cutibacterium equinum]WCC79457.1 PspC domain-containing protein [Cutibacterium equinum]
MATKLTRPQEGRIIGGVCQGIANALDVDPTIVRVIAALLVLAAGSGPLLYLVLWMIIPEEGSGESVAGDLARKARQKQASPRSGDAWNFDETTSARRHDENFNPYTED